MRFTPQDEEFRADVRESLAANLTGPFAGLRGVGGGSDEIQRNIIASRALGRPR